MSSSPFGLALLAEPNQGGSPQVSFLSQGWSSSTREAFHYAPQGSELIPYFWFLNLTEPDGATLLKDNLTQYGVLYDNFTPGVKHRNPDHLPIGFARQEESRSLGGITEKHWLGFTCAACHTGAIVPKSGANPFKKGTILIDGAPAKFDVAAFLTKLQASVQATNDDPARLEALAQKAFAAGDGSSVEEIVDRFHNYTRQLNEILPLYLPKLTSGPGRLDCFGAIINRVCVYDLKSNQTPPAKLNAPVDFPFIWYTDRQDQIQWYGELPNKSWFSRLGRNAGEVSGVFAQVLVTPTSPKDGYPSSVDVAGLGRIDRYVSALKSPKWSEVFPAPDRKAVSRGKKIFHDTCQSGKCHGNLAPQYQVASVKPTPLLPYLNTDENNTRLIHETYSDTSLSSNGPVNVKMPATQVVGAIVAAELVEDIGSVIQAYIEYWLDRIFHVSFDVASESQKAEAKKRVQAEMAQQSPAQYSMVNPSKLGAPQPPAKFDPWKNGYESRSMNGIWATAPYLHNGSVPSLYDLLWPKQRPKTFYVGSNVYDPVKMGFVSDGSAGGTVFDASQPGNSNKGHLYGATLKPAQKNDLLAYLKSL